MNISGSSNNNTGGSTSSSQQYLEQVQVQNFQIYEGIEDIVSVSSSQGVSTSSQTLLCNLNILKEKLQQVQSLVSMVVNHHHGHQQTHDLHGDDSIVKSVTTAGSLIQDIIVSATSMMYAFQQAAAFPSSSSTSVSNNNNSNLILHHQQHAAVVQQQQPAIVVNHLGVQAMDPSRRMVGLDTIESADNKDCDIIELNAADLLAKYTHHCQICGKGFKRDANLRMHMRAHGDEYKTNAALSNPMKANSSSGDGDQVAATAAGRSTTVQRKYSCPQEGCRWNRKHAKFQPLKSMICVKNHYRRSHCPKMYACNRCNRKQFSVLSDLRTHEKHCGDLKWQCACGNTFSRKDKLMGHLTLFAGHTPVVSAPELFAGQQQQQQERIVLDREFYAAMQMDFGER